MSTTRNNGTRTSADRPAAAGRAPGARPGSALVLVVGALAIMSVFAAIYIAIGQADQRTAATIERTRSYRDVSRDVGNYLAAIVAADRLDYYWTPSYPGVSGTTIEGQMARRETFDLPYTDRFLRSVPGLPGAGIPASDQPARRFRPQGGGQEAWAGSNVRDDARARGSDPYLASSEPEYLGPTGDGLGGGAGAPHGRIFSGDLAEFFYFDNRDWRQISNIAPDGRYVNLYNLRPHAFFGDGTVGSFDAPSELGVSTVDGRQVRGISYGLSNWRLAQPNNAGSPLQADEVYWLPGESTPISFDATNPVDLNVPARFGMYQRYLTFPARGPFYTLDREGEEAGWFSPDFPPYQYADADGDGLYDARWQELVDAWVPTEVRQALPRDEGIRWFVAARIEDLSGRGNVNAHLDGLAPPVGAVALGIRPTLDLRRLLTMEDASTEYRWSAAIPPAPAVTQSLGLSYTILERPFNRPGLDRSFDYRPYQYLLDQDSPAEKLGWYAYDALRLAVDRQMTIDRRIVGEVDPSVNPDRLGLVVSLISDSRFNLTDSGVADLELVGESHIDYYDAVGALDPSVAGSMQRFSEDFGRGLFDVDDLAELLTYDGLNDPDQLSRLEQTVTGRYVTSAPDGELVSLSPLLSNRPLSFDRDRHGLDARSGATPRQTSGRLNPSSLALFALTPRSRLTTLSGAAGLRSAGGVQAGSGLAEDEAAVDLLDVVDSASGLFDVYASALFPFSRESFMSDGALIPNAAQVVERMWLDDLSLLSLNPIAAPLAWQVSRTAFYGHNGPEQALRIAAHLAVNMKDAYDEGNEPTAATLILDDDIRDELDRPTGNIRNHDFPWWREPGGALDLRDPDDPPQDATVLPNDHLVVGGASKDPGVTGPVRDSRRAVNVFGVEAYPVLTEVASMTIYTDAPQAAGGDDDDSGNWRGPDQLPVNPDHITINFDSQDAGDWSSNTDFVLELLAFQISNPWDKPISLAATGAAQDQILERPTDSQVEPFLYYIEYGGRFYKLGQYVEPREPDPDNPGQWRNVDPNERYRNVVIGPGESQVFYVLATDEFGDFNTNNTASVNGRWRAILDAMDGPLDKTPWTATREDRGPAHEWVDRQLTVRGPGSRQVRPVRIREFDPRSGVVINSTNSDGYVDRLREPDSSDLLVNRDPDLNVVRLWRRMSTTASPPGRPGQTATERTTENYLNNDLLVDRLREPLFLERAENARDNTPGDNGTVLNQRLSGGNTTIEDTVSFEEDVELNDDSDGDGCPDSNDADGDFARNDNTGWTVIRWASFRRPDGKPTGGVPPTQAGVGRVPAWMIEPRQQRELGNIVSPGPEDRDDAGYDDIDRWAERCRGSSSISDARAVVAMRPDFETQRSLWDLMEMNQNGPIVIRTIGVHPNFKVDIARGGRFDSPDDAGNNTVNKFLVAELGRGTGRSLAFNGFVQGDELDYNQVGALRPELFLDNNAFEDDEISYLRPGDLMLALGIGPSFAPDQNRPPTDLNFDEKEWVTLPEALAIALGFDNPADEDWDPDLQDVWRGMADGWQPQQFDLRGATPRGQIAADRGAREPRYVLPNGQLAIDDFVPFFDLGGGQRVGPAVGPFEIVGRQGNPALPDGEFDPEIDVRVGSGVPMALKIPGMVRGIPLRRFDSSDDPDPLTTKVMGKVNLNTAPPAVARALSILTPSGEDFPVDAAAQRMPNFTGSRVPNWWGSPASTSDGLPNMDGYDPQAPATSLSQWEQRPDVAGSLLAYRDRRAAEFRRVSNDPDVGVSLGVLARLSYEPAGFAQRAQASTLVLLSDENFAADSGRFALTRITGLREQPGFATPGEVAAVTAHHPNPELDEPHPQFYNLMTALGENGQRIDASIAAISPDEPLRIERLYEDGSGDFEADRLEDELDERLALTNGLLNTIDVRSDVFAVWFVIQGYRASDVENLQEDDPMVPTVHKRFVMVVDRSNVVEPGDRPRIVLFREVPL